MWQARFFPEAAEAILTCISSAMLRDELWAEIAAWLVAAPTRARSRISPLLCYVDGVHVVGKNA